MHLFTKLSTLTRQSPLVLLTIAREGPLLRVTVTPKHGGKIEPGGDALEAHEAALVTPLSMLGTAAEFDEGFEAELDRYLGKREDLVATVGDYETEIAEARLNLKGKTAESQKKRGAPVALAAPPAKPALPDQGPAPAGPAASKLAEA